MRGKPRHDTRLIARLPPSFEGMDAFTNECSFDSQDTWILTYSFDMLTMGACTTRYWQMSGRLVQELNVCTVLLIFIMFLLCFMFCVSLVLMQGCHLYPNQAYVRNILPKVSGNFWSIQALMG